MADNKQSAWENLTWKDKVTLSQTGEANEDSLLHTYVVLFIAMEAILFATLMAKGWGNWWSIIIGVFGIGLTIAFMFILENRGNAVDHWAVILHDLWKEAGNEELAAYYEGAVKRRKERQKRYGKVFVFFGWGKLFNFERFKSTRRWLIFFIPLVVMILWILIMVVSFVCH